MLTAGGARGGQRGGEGRGGQEEGGGWTRGTRRWWWWRWFQRLCPSGRSVMHVLRASLVVAVWRGVLCCSYAWAVWHSSQLISQQWKHMSIAPVTSDIAVSDCWENTHNSNDSARKTHIAILTPVIFAKVVGLWKDNRCVAEAPVTADSVVLFLVRSVEKGKKNVY